MGTSCRVLTLVMMFLLASMQPAVAQEQGVTADVTQIDVKQLEATLAAIEDDTKRAEFTGHLRSLIQIAKDGQVVEDSSSAGAQAFRDLSDRVHTVGSRMLAALTTLAALPASISRLPEIFDNAERRRSWLNGTWKIVLVLFSGWLAERLVRRLLQRARTSLDRVERPRFWSRMSLQFARLLLDVLAFGAFALVAYGMLSTVNPADSTSLLALALINATVVARFIGALARVVLSPELAPLRLLPASDESAQYWVLWIRRLTVFSVYGYVFIETGLLLGLSPQLHAVLVNLLGLGILAMLLVLVQQNRLKVTASIAGRELAKSTVRTVRRRLAELWYVFTVLYLLVVYGVWVSGVPGGFALILRGSLATLAIVAIAVMLGLVVHRLVDRWFRLNDELRASYPLLELRANRYVPRIKTALNILICAVAGIAIVQVWGIDLLPWFESELGRTLTGSFTTVLFLILGAVVVWEVVSVVIEHLVNRAQNASVRSARLETLLPLARKATFVVLVSVVSLTVLAELGINIGPLLAGAGVLGLAIGFGAQTLVKDIITGIFILIEDTISIGDYVEVSGHEGTVESISIRTIRLRDIEGSVHTMPFSEVSTVVNYTRDFGISMLNIGVAYKEDVDHVIGVLNQLGEEFMQDPELAQYVLEPLVVQGLHKLEDSAVIIRAKIRTTAGMQWAMRRAFYKLMKKRFDELGIEIPFPHQTIYFGAGVPERDAPAT